ncbi:MAG: serine/threonine protein kinase [Cyanobacteria bacterium SZAS TMP-1]|nr:serine/threonine protein kinase [Cyanobacteria bacterium SZAS TMP-1]
MSVWDERDIPSKRPQGQSPRATGEFQAMGRVTGTAPIVKRPDGTTYLPAGSVYNDKYATIQVLGEGGISIVYKARHSVMKNIVAIKLLNGTYPTNSPTILRFQREMQAVSRLNHPCFVRVYEYGISREGQPFIVLDYLEGTSLAKLLAQYGPMPVAKALPVFIQVAEALAVAHAAGVNHHDLKPTNIFLTEPDTDSPKVKIFDFGLAETFDSIENDPDALTPSRVPWRSPFYMSPEQCQGRNLDDRSDVYGLGCLMYKALTNMPPVKGENFAQTMQMQEQQMPVTFEELAPDDDDLAWIEPVVFKCLAKDPGNRYQTMAQLARALKEVRDRRTARSAPGPMPPDLGALEAERKAALLRKGLIIGGAAAVVLAIGGGIFYAKSNTIELKAIGPTSQACFELDKGHYGEAKKRFAELLAGAKNSKSDDGTWLYLSDEAVLNHILADKQAEGNDEQALTDLATARGEHLNADTGAMHEIDTALASDKTGEELDAALAKPVASLISQAQELSWNQKYAQAREIMSPLPGKLEEKLGGTSPLVIDVKVQYAMMLLQKIINPLAPLTLAQKQDLVSEPKALLEEPLSEGQDTELWLARSNYALAQALSGEVDEAKKLREEILSARTSGTISGDKAAYIETRLGDVALALDERETALPLYQSAYQHYLGDKNFAAANYCASIYCRVAKDSGNAKDSLDFLNKQLQNAALNVPEAAGLRSELQAWLADLNYSMTSDRFMQLQGSGLVKPSGDLMREAEKLASESLMAGQERRVADRWLSDPALDTLIRVYSSGGNVGKAVPLLRVKLAVAERTASERAADNARHNLGTALLSYGRSAVAQTNAKLDGIEVTGDKTDPKEEARALLKQSTGTSGGIGDNRILWLDDHYVELAGNFVDNAADKAVMLVAAGASCNKTEEIYGKNSREYLSQLRGQGLLAWRFKHNGEAKKSLVDARDIVQANPGLPLMDRKAVYSDLIMVCEGMKDSAAVKTYTAEMQALVKQ